MKPVLAALLCTLLILGGCLSIDEIKSKVDTDGDGVPETAMNQDQIVAWAKLEEKKAQKELEAETRGREAELRRIQRDAQRRIIEIQEKATAESRRVQEQLEDGVDALKLGMEGVVGKKEQWLAQVQATADGGLKEIKARQDQIEGIVGFLQGPVAQSLAGLVPGGSVALTALVGLATGGVFGRKIGAAAGREEGVKIGEEKREAVQAKIDTHYDMGQAELMKMLMAAKNPMGVGQAS